MGREPTQLSLDDRLKALARDTAELLERPEVRRERAVLAQRARQMALVDMSDTAIDSRLRRLGMVSRLCASLAHGAD